MKQQFCKWRGLKKLPCFRVRYNKSSLNSAFLFQKCKICIMRISSKIVTQHNRSSKQRQIKEKIKHFECLLLYYILSEKYDSKFSLNIVLKNKNRTLSHASFTLSWTLWVWNSKLRTWSVNVDTKIYSIGPYIVHDYY